MNCPKKYFSTIGKIGFNLAPICWGVDEISGLAHVRLELPTVFLGYMTPMGSVKEINFASVAKQVQYAKLLQQIHNAMLQSNADYPNGASGGLVFYLEGEYPNYMTDYIGQTGLASTFQFQHNFDVAQIPISMVREFWSDESTTPDPGTLTMRIYELCEHIINLSNLRLWLPPGSYEFPINFGPTPPSDTILAAFADPDVGNSEELLMLGIELKSIE